MVQGLGELLGLSLTPAFLLRRTRATESSTVAGGVQLAKAETAWHHLNSQLHIAFCEEIQGGGGVKQNGAP